MGKLEELKTLVAEMFKDADDKKSIEQLAAVNNKISEVEKEQTSLTEKNAELIKSYKDLVQHTSFKDEKLKPQDIVGANAPSFEEMLKNFKEN